MKKFVVSALAGTLLALGSMSASAIVISGTEVGDLDSFKGSADLPNSGLATEAAYIDFVLGNGVTAADISQLQVPGDATEVCEGTLCYVDLGAGTSYSFFMLKFGASPGYPDHYLYENTADLRYAVYDRKLNGLGEETCGPQGNRSCIGGLSHVTIPDDGNNDVPAPGALGLLGAGLLGLGAMRRRKNAA